MRATFIASVEHINVKYDSQKTKIVLHFWAWNLRFYPKGIPSQYIHVAVVITTFFFFAFILVGFSSS